MVCLPDKRCVHREPVEPPPPDVAAFESEGIAVEWGELPTELIFYTKAVPWAIALPADHSPSAAPLPLVLHIHGAGGNHLQMLLDDNLSEIRSGAGSSRAQTLMRAASARGQRVAMLTIHCLGPGVESEPLVSDNGWYTDWRDGRALWETFITQELLPFARERWNLTSDRRKTAIRGMSMGGCGSLRIGLRNLELFGIVCGLEPAIEATLEFDDIPIESKGSGEFLPVVHALPGTDHEVDREHYRAHNPAVSPSSCLMRLDVDRTLTPALSGQAIVRDDPQRIIDSGVRILLDCGSRDEFFFHTGTEYLHRTLTDCGVEHEYRAVLAGTHVGDDASLRLDYCDQFVLTHLERPEAAAELDETGEFL